MAWTSLSPWAVGEKIKAVKLSTLVTAIQQLQTNNTEQTYNQTKSSFSWTSNAARQDFTSWPTSGGFTSSGAGLTVPSKGAYIVTMIGTLSSGSFAATTRYYLECDDSSGTFVHGNPATGASENTICVTGVTRQLNAGSAITPYRFQNTGSSITLSTVRLIIARIPAQTP